MKDDSDSSWNADARYERDLEREPTRRAPRNTNHPLDARGTLRQQFQSPVFCGEAEHDAGWDTMRRDGVMAYALDFVLDHRTCLKCKGSFSRKVETSTEEALRILRESGAL